MNNLKRLSYEQLKQQRDLLVNAKAFSICDFDRKVFQKSIEGIENEMYLREIGNVKHLIMTVNVLVLGSILFLAGCQTLKGVTGDAGWILTEMSDNIKTQEK